ncbi:MAG: antibiotic biosynthesis monooxygenase [Dokdonella sp.]
MTAQSNLMVLYRWRVRPDREETFVDAWSLITRQLRERGSHGSRLHRGDDGLFYGYAQWADADAITLAFAQPMHEDAASRMRDAVVENFPPVRLAPIADFLVPFH